MTELTSEQELALAVELTTAVKLCEAGLRCLHELDAENDFYHLPLQLLAQGFERLLKLTFSLAERRQIGALPTADRLKRYGHNLTRITDDLVLLVSREKEYTSRPAVQDDLEFINTDSEIRHVLTFLSSFGAQDRYYHLEEFLDPSSVNANDDPDLVWQEMESKVLKDESDWINRLTSEDSGDLYERIYEGIAFPLERFARAISRMWTLGALGDESRSYLGNIKTFLFIPDEQLGKKRI